MFQDDYFMRQIEALSKMLGQLIFFKRTDDNIVEIFDAQGNVISEGLLLHKLKHMIAKGEINEAENLLFDEIESQSGTELLPVAIAFYQSLAELSEARLAQCNYSPEEIIGGLQSVQHIFEARAA